MAKNIIEGSGTEFEYAGDNVVGEPNSFTEKRTHQNGALKGLPYDAPVAIDTGALVGRKTDNTIHLAFAGVGATQLRAEGITYQSFAFGVNVDIRSMPCTLVLGTPLVGGLPGQAVYLSTTVRGGFQLARPNVTGQLIQKVGSLIKGDGKTIRYFVSGEWSVA